MSLQSHPVLVVEDDDNDVFFLKYAFESAGISTPIQVVSDGQQAIEYLSGNGPYGDRQRYPLPCLILLDLKLPICMGHDVLRWIQQQQVLPIQMVIVLSSSADPTDIEQAYRLGARSFLVKPLSVDKRLEMARAIKMYWLDLNQFPL
jgi:CheY-like chemotaxis protein